LARPDLTSAVLVLSGVPPRAEQPVAAGSLGGLPAFVAHGTHDPLIPVEAGQAIRDLLQAAGAVVAYREYPVGHMVIPEEVSDARTWVARATA